MSATNPAYWAIMSPGVTIERVVDGFGERVGPPADSAA
jgi:hypothetical protein